MDLAALFHDEVGRESFVVHSERQRSHRRVGIRAVDRIAAPRTDFEGDSQLRERRECGYREGCDLLSYVRVVLNSVHLHVGFGAGDFQRFVFGDRSTRHQLGALRTTLR
ncbi:hypothetical protein NBRGN_112_01270 [Nocardia brasiliensis NBRC 14402]|nr:hypothetical protein NBRGN_112_01270 [Nocardia brasiliensis NBRC 14402]